MIFSFFFKHLLQVDIATECNEGTQVCQQGECKGSICLKYGLEQCFLSSSDGKHSTRDLCELACQEPGRNNTCKSTGKWVESGERANRGLTEKLSLRPGAPCDNFQGYCDVFRKCRQVGRFTLAVLDHQNLPYFRRWMLRDL